MIPNPYQNPESAAPPPRPVTVAERRAHEAEIDAAMARLRRDYAREARAQARRGRRA